MSDRNVVVSSGNGVETVYRGRGWYVVTAPTANGNNTRTAGSFTRKDDAELFAAALRWVLEVRDPDPEASPK